MNDRQPAPSGCRRCGIPERSHFQGVASGSHQFEQPTVSQIKARMVSRRISGGKVMCCEECPPQVTCGSVVCTVRRSLYDYPTLHKNRTDVLHYLMCVIGNGFEWFEDGCLRELVYEVYPDEYGLKGVQPSPDDPRWANRSYMDDQMRAEMLADWEAEQAELKAVRDNVDELARTSGAPLSGEVYEESREYARMFIMPDNVMPDWKAAAEEILPVVEPVWAARRAERAAVEAGPALSQTFSNAAFRLERRAAQADTAPWWEPMIGMLRKEAARLYPLFKHVQRDQAKPELLEMAERIMSVPALLFGVTDTEHSVTDC